MSLRLAVVSTLKEHPMLKEWISSVFHKKKRDFIKFVNAQTKSGAYTDVHGIMVLATAQYLNVVFEIVPTSGSQQCPTYKIPDDIIQDDPRPVHVCGYLQDETDRQVPGKPGHWQCLVRVSQQSNPSSEPTDEVTFEPVPFCFHRW